MEWSTSRALRSNHLTYSILLIARSLQMVSITSYGFSGFKNTIGQTILNHHSSAIRANSQMV